MRPSTCPSSTTTSTAPPSSSPPHLINGCKIRGCRMEELRVTINGAGAAGIAVTKLLLGLGIGDVVLCDRQGAIFEGRAAHGLLEGGDRAADEQGSPHWLARRRHHRLRRLHRSLGRWRPDPADGARDGPNPLVFALANPVPEITPDLAREAGALAVATGRSDYPNQVNNSLAFPGVFRGALDVKARSIDDAMKIAAARYRRAGRCLRALARFPDPRQPRSPRRTSRRRGRCGSGDQRRPGSHPLSIRARSRCAAAISSMRGRSGCKPVTAWGSTR